MPRKIRPIRIEGNVAYVPLTRGFVAIVDADDADQVGRWNWQAFVVPHTVYATRRCVITNDTIYLHRQLLDAPKGLTGDHRDCDGLNNRRYNLRLATQSQNCMNQRKSAANTSGIKGVSFFKPTQRWRAVIQIAGRQKHIGLFDTPEAAYAAYCKASAELHGEFGRTA